MCIMLYWLSLDYFVQAVSIAYAGMAEWQTHQTQNLTMATSCGFKSHFLHFKRLLHDATTFFLSLFLHLIQVTVPFFSDTGDNPLICQDQKTRLRQPYLDLCMLRELFRRKRLRQVIWDKLHIIFPPVKAYFLDKFNRDTVIPLTAFFPVPTPSV